MRLNWWISFNHSSEDLSFHIWKLNSEMCKYAFSSFETEVEMTGFTTFHMLEKHHEDSGSFFPLAGSIRSVVDWRHNCYCRIIAVTGWAITAGSYCRNRERRNGLSLWPSLLSESRIEQHYQSQLFLVFLRFSLHSFAYIVM